MWAGDVDGDGLADVLAALSSGRPDGDGSGQIVLYTSLRRDGEVAFRPGRVVAETVGAASLAGVPARAAKGRFHCRQGSNS